MKKYGLILCLLLPFLNACGTSNSVINYEFDDANLTARIISTPQYSMSDLIIPETIEKDGKVYKVESIAVNSFINNNYLKKVVIPDSIISIGYDAFRNCEKLEEVVIGDGLTFLADHIFADCIRLKTFEGGKNIDTLYTGVLQNTALESITFNNLKSMNVDCFWNNSKLKSVSLGGSIKNIPGSTFEKCPLLETVSLGSSITSIDNYAFKNCESLKSFDFENIDIIGAYAFQNTALEKINLNLEVLSEGAFYDCDELNDVSLNVSTISYRSFEECQRLVNLNLKNVNEIGSKAFFNSAITSLDVPSTVNVINSQAFENSSLEELTFQDQSSLIRISRRAFASNPLKGIISFPSSLERIYVEAFADTEIEEINLSSKTIYEDNSFPEKTIINNY